jgi:hypothetical protein
MLKRCNNPNDKGYHNYGERGIEVCKRWYDFRNFLADMGPRPDGLTLERKDNDGNYEPENCCWATLMEQAANTRSLRMFIAMDQQGTLVASNNQHEFARQRGLNQRHISDCLRGKRKQHRSWRFQWM